MSKFFSEKKRWQKRGQKGGKRGKKGVKKGAGRGEKDGSDTLFPDRYFATKTYSDVKKTYAK